MTIVHVVEGGLSLPDRDYYLKEDPKSVDIRKKFEQHVQKMFVPRGAARRRRLRRSRWWRWKRNWPSLRRTAWRAVIL